VRELCPEVAVLARGRVVAAGPANSILDDEALLRENGLV
jgi:hypothetical protein